MQPGAFGEKNMNTYTYTYSVFNHPRRGMIVTRGEPKELGEHTTDSLIVVMGKREIHFEIRIAAATAILDRNPGGGAKDHLINARIVAGNAQAAQAHGVFTLKRQELVIKAVASGRFGAVGFSRHDYPTSAFSPRSVPSGDTPEEVYEKIMQCGAAHAAPHR